MRLKNYRNVPTIYTRRRIEAYKKRKFLEVRELKSRQMPRASVRYWVIKHGLV